MGQEGKMGLLRIEEAWGIGSTRGEVRVPLYPGNWLELKWNCTVHAPPSLFSAAIQAITFFDRSKRRSGWVLNNLLFTEVQFSSPPDSPSSHPQQREGEDILKPHTTSTGLIVRKLLPGRTPVNRCQVRDRDERDRDEHDRDEVTRLSAPQ